MRIGGGSLLQRVEAGYLRAHIDSGDNRRIKTALQSLSKQYRKGRRLHPNDVNGVVNSVVGTAFRPSIDEKVRRWVLNTLARIGREEMCLPAIQHILRRHSDEPQTVAAGIAAIYKLCTQTSPEEALDGIDFDPQMRTLAALQHVDANQIDKSGLPVDVERASAEVLKLALLVVGLDRSPENLLNPRHSDGEMVKALGQHHDSVVSQYTVWAITENDKLRLIHLGINLKEIESQPENVRGWMFQLLAMEATPKCSHWEYIRLGMNDRSSEARLGLASGLKDIFLDFLVPLSIDWIGSESDAEIRNAILDHIVHQSGKSLRYLNYAIDLYQSEPDGSSLRERMEVSAIGLPIYAEFQKIKSTLPDMFEGGNTVVNNNTFNVGNINAGAVAIGTSQATNSGDTSIMHFSQEAINEIQTNISKIEEEVHNLQLLAEDKERILKYISEARSNPNKGNIKNIVEYIDHLCSVSSSLVTLAPYAATLAGMLAG